LNGNKDCERSLTTQAGLEMKILQEILERIIAQAEQEAPIETCGYLAGKDECITQCYPVKNDDQREDHFTFNAEGQLSALTMAEQEGLEVIALYHSHPVGAAWPSAEDVRLAFDPSILYVIIPLTDKEKTVRAFHIKQGRIEEEELIVSS